jgi:IS605 OrfB family transposase
MRACNAAASRAAEVAFAHGTVNKLRLQTLVYADLRAEFGLSAQMAVRSIAKACEAYKRDKKIQPVFRPDGRRGPGRREPGRRLRRHRLLGRAVHAVRYRNRQLRARLQAKGTKSAKRLLRKRRRREARFSRDTNHCISKALVGKAKDTGRGIKLEDLSGIRSRTTVRKAQRADCDSWTFYQLRQFVTYKAAIAGVPVARRAPPARQGTAGRLRRGRGQQALRERGFDHRQY